LLKLDIFNPMARRLVIGVAAISGRAQVLGTRFYQNNQYD